MIFDCIILLLSTFPYWDEHVTSETVKTVRRWLGRSLACRTLYWIAVIGPHWRYGGKDDDGQPKLSKLIPWHDTTHDDASLPICKLLLDWSVHFSSNGSLECLRRAIQSGWHRIWGDGSDDLISTAGAVQWARAKINGTEGQILRRMEEGTRASCMSIKQCMR
jgi:hypothetical protein